jgi:hypothetical protein
MEERRLNEIEYLLMTFGQPNNISMSVTISGTLDHERLKNSLDLVRAKHPMLQAQVYLKDKKILI